MFLRANKRFKDGKAHRYWSIVESYRAADDRILQRPVLYLGEINDSQHAAWCRAIDVLDEGRAAVEPLALFPDDRPVPALRCATVQIRLSALTLHRPRRSSSTSMRIGRHGCGPRARARAGSTCSRPWSAIG
ncbi:MAG: hypothetical protein MUF57_10690 [Gammaproteobacteria bacterium]|nr:hypothetical protein [Gammaproteobacteria bacterium]